MRLLSTFFPAIRGVQAGREYYISMCPLRLIPKIFLFDEEELVPELRAQRVLNKTKVPEIARYLPVIVPDISSRRSRRRSTLRFSSKRSRAGQRAAASGYYLYPMKARFIITMVSTVERPSKWHFGKLLILVMRRSRSYSSSTSG